MGEDGRKSRRATHRQSAPPRALLVRTSCTAGWLGADLLLRAARALGPAVDPPAGAPFRSPRPCSPRSIVDRSVGDEA